MAEAINLADERTKRAPHASGECQCLGCKHKWVAVYPLPIEADLECPDCGLHRGLPIYNHAPEIAYTCTCGSIYHIFSPENAVCIQCGFLTPLDSL